MQAVLVMFRNDGERRSFSISREMTVIGRRQDCDLMIPLGEISRKHCRIIRDGEALRLEDLGSSNGTFHNGRRVQEAELSAGDTIQVGPVAFVVQLDGQPEEEDMKPHTGGAAHAATAADDDDDELETLSDDGEPTPASELDSEDSDELEPIESDSDELEPVGLDDQPASPKGGRDNAHDDDELEVLSSDQDSASNIHDLDAEIGENLELDGDPLEGLDDSTAGEITLDDKKHKPRST
jgi:pSer/pThr/pTyr-binding forkhead associated (FHA) protein